MQVPPLLGRDGGAKVITPLAQALRKIKDAAQGLHHAGVARLCVLMTTRTRGLRQIKTRSGEPRFAESNPFIQPV